MDAKIFVYGFCLVAIICGATFWSYTMEIDEVQKDVFSARQQLALNEDAIKQAKGWLTARKEASALISAAAIIEKDNEVIRGEIAAIRTRRRDVAKAFVGSIERARTEFVGITFPEIILASGTRFRNAKVQSHDAETTVLHHSEGVSKVPTTDLPPEVQDRLRYGFNPGGIGTPGGNKSTSSTTSVSDKIVRLGMSSAPSVFQDLQDAQVAAPTVGDRTPPSSSTVSGQRESLGRVYVPGKGWQRSGAGGVVPPPQLSTNSPVSSSRNSEAVSKVKTRAEMSQENGQLP